MPNRQTNKQEVSIPSTLLKHRNGWIYWLVVTGRHASLSLDHDVVIHYHSPGDSKINQTWTLASSSLFPLFLYSSKDSSFCGADICLSDNKSRLMVNRCRLRNRKFTFLFKFELEIRRNSVFHLSTCQLASIKWQWERASEEKELIRFTKHWLRSEPTRERERQARRGHDPIIMICAPLNLDPLVAIEQIMWQSPIECSQVPRDPCECGQKQCNRLGGIVQRQYTSGAQRIRAPNQQANCVPKAQLSNLKN